MNKIERNEIRGVVADFAQWIRLAAQMYQWRDEVERRAAAWEHALFSRSVEIAREGQVVWRVLALTPTEAGALSSLWERAHLPRLAPDDVALLRSLTNEAQRASADVSTILSARRFFTNSARKQTAEAAAEFLRRLHSSILAAGGPQRLAQLSTYTATPRPERLTFADLIDPAMGFNLVSRSSGPAPTLLDRATFAELPRALQIVAKVVASEAAYRSAVVEAGEKVRDAEVKRVLQEMPVDTLKTVTRDRLRLGALSDAQITTVQSVLELGHYLQALPGVGATSARRMIGAAQTIRQVTFDEMPVRIDITARHTETTHLLRRLAEWDTCRVTKGAESDLARASELAPLAAAIAGQTSRLLVIPTATITAEGLREGIDIVRRRAAMLGMSSASAATSASTDPWEDFLARPADYFAMLAELGFITENDDAVHGDLPDEIIQAVRNQALSGEHLTASLRGYQSFAARFALAQKKVIIGDEMGLGKTVEALAVLAHLRSRGETHFLVICPAAVVTNWMREVTTKSRLRPHRVHGPGRERAAKSWQRDGGVAVTTYESLAWWLPTLTQRSDPACVVIDEAHYIKNPQARRTTRTRSLISSADRAILLTGTPLENKVEEFRNLASYVRPDLTVTVSDLSPRAFRRQVAPAYLRRNQEDVLAELPDLIEVEEWLPMSEADTNLYREAVGQGNFMAMRQAAMLARSESEKLRRLAEIVREAEDNERRIIVFSHFREVLNVVAGAVPGPAFGPLTGAVPANQRQEMVDRFSSARHGAVLVAQIVAGGVGLNIQAASVIVICEPQLKPTTEAQAIARAHRMGQVRSVQVHRLLSEDSVDQRISELLARKKLLFDEFARVSDTADSTAEAVDISEAELARQVVSAERQRLHMTPLAKS